jgi:2-(1,2-epoxy-1,2-dihydrophenyl)acetyl-CoA isomerase
VSEIEDLARRLYAALGAGDAAAIDELLAPDFDGHLADGMPLGLGGVKRGAGAMRDEGWWAIGRAFAARAEPDEWIRCADGRLLVLGRYRGRARTSGGALDAAFAHLWTAAGGRLTALRHFTDTARWTDALAGSPGDSAH